MSTTTQTKAPIETEEEPDLPEGWCAAELPDIAAITMGQSPPGSTYNDQKEGLPFFQGKADFGERFPTVRVWCAQPNKIAQPGDILISVRAPVGPTNVATEVCAIGRGLAGIRPLGDIPTEFILFTLRLQEPELALSGTGSTFTAISRKDLDTIPINVPPLAEQVRIVAKIEELFIQVNASRERLAKVPKVLKAFRQSVLAAACSGRLTEDWREKNPKFESAERLLQEIKNEVLGERGRSRNIEQNLESEPFELPTLWQWASVADVCTSVTDGDHQPPPKAESGIPFIVISNISDRRLDLSDTMFVPIGYYEALSETRKPQKNDILYSVTGSYGIPVLISDNKKFCFQRHIALLRPHSKINAAYVHRVMDSDLIYEQATQVATGIAQMTVPLSGLRVLRLPVPPLEEQHEIVRRVEALFKLADKIEKCVEAATKRADKLTQAILAKAFRGELVPTEAELARKEGRDYEPTSLLLARIKAEREKSSAATNNGKRPRRKAKKN